MLVLHSRLHVLGACRVPQVRNCKGLGPVLGMLLALGNHMNSGTGKGQADGFSLFDLAKTSVTKDNTNTTTLLGYAVQARREEGEGRQ